MVAWLFLFNIRRFSYLRRWRWNVWDFRNGGHIGCGRFCLFDLTTTAPPRGTWQILSAPLTAEDWEKTSLEWMAILAGVTEIAMSTDAFDGADTIGIDNFTLAPVPLPATVWLLFSALSGLGLLHWHRKVDDR